MHNIFFSNDYQRGVQRHFRRQNGGRRRDGVRQRHLQKTPADAPAGHENWFVMVNVPHDARPGLDALTQNTRRAACWPGCAGALGIGHRAAHHKPKKSGRRPALRPTRRRSGGALLRQLQSNNRAGGLPAPPQLLGPARRAVLLRRLGAPRRRHSVVLTSQPKSWRS
ncbi:MAG: hypothetical protein WKG07_24100 [Hymenobacter sp.]